MGYLVRARTMAEPEFRHMLIKLLGKRIPHASVGLSASASGWRDGRLAVVSRTKLGCNWYVGQEQRWEEAHIAGATPEIGKEHKLQGEYLTRTESFPVDSWVKAEKTGVEARRRYRKNWKVKHRNWREWEENLSIRNGDLAKDRSVENSGKQSASRALSSQEKRIRRCERRRGALRPEKRCAKVVCAA
jgi:hypothetical protein